MRAFTATVTAAVTAAVFTLGVGASAAPAPAEEPAEAVEFFQAPAPAPAVELREAPAAETATATADGHTIYQPPAPDPAPTSDYPAVCDDPTADVFLEPGVCPMEAPGADLPIPSIEAQIEDCVIQEGNREWCENKIRHGIIE